MSKPHPFAAGIHGTTYAVLRETGGNGVGRLVEATGASSMVNNSFSLLRYSGGEEQREWKGMSKASNNVCCERLLMPRDVVRVHMLFCLFI